MDTSSNLSPADRHQVPTPINYAHMYSEQNERTMLLYTSLYENTYCRCCDRMAKAILGIFLVVGCIVGTYLLFYEEHEDGHYQLIRKAEWTEVQPQVQMQKLRLPIKNISIVELHSRKCIDKSLSTGECLQYIQHKHIFKFNEPDILYNFIIDGNGTVYEGRGWKNSTVNDEFSGKQLTIATLLGNLKHETRAVKSALHNFLGSAVIKDKLEPCFGISSHNGSNVEDVVSYIERRRHFC